MLTEILFNNKQNIMIILSFILFIYMLSKFSSIILLIILSFICYKYLTINSMNVNIENIKKYNLFNKMFNLL